MESGREAECDAKQAEVQSDADEIGRLRLYINVTTHSRLRYIYPSTKTAPLFYEALQNGIEDLKR
jgi:hypothetical protein